MAVNGYTKSNFMFMARWKDSNPKRWQGVALLQHILTHEAKLTTIWLVRPLTTINIWSIHQLESIN